MIKIKINHRNFKRIHQIINIFLFRNNGLRVEGAKSI
jgi:hypothetical protein